MPAPMLILDENACSRSMRIRKPRKECRVQVKSEACTSRFESERKQRRPGGIIRGLVP